MPRQTVAPHQTVVNRICRYFDSLVRLPSEQLNLWAEDKLEKRTAVCSFCLSEEAVIDTNKTKEYGKRQTEEGKCEKY